MSSSSALACSLIVTLTATAAHAQAVSSPFHGVPLQVPGTIQAEDFDEGGEGIGYHDLTAYNEGGAYRATDVDVQPTTDAGGSGFPEERTVIDGEPESSVVVRFPVDAPPGRNSWTRPLTLSASPTLTAGVDEVKTKMPSEVAGSESGLGSCIQKPLVLFAVTVPRVVTVWPLSGEVWEAP